MRGRRATQRLVWLLMGEPIFTARDVPGGGEGELRAQRGAQGIIRRRTVHDRGMTAARRERGAGAFSPVAEPPERSPLAQVEIARDAPMVENVIRKRRFCSARGLKTAFGPHEKRTPHQRAPHALTNGADRRTNLTRVDCSSTHTAQRSAISRRSAKLPDPAPIRESRGGAGLVRASAGLLARTAVE
jgi:hypothetical protein